MMIEKFKRFMAERKEVGHNWYIMGTIVYLLLIIVVGIFTFTFFIFYTELHNVQLNITNVCMSVNVKAICDTFCDSPNCFMSCNGKNITLEQLPYQNFTLERSPWLNGTELAEKCNALTLVDFYFLGF